MEYQSTNESSNNSQQKKMKKPQNAHALNEDQASDDEESNVNVFPRVDD